MFQQISTKLRRSNSPCLQGCHEPLTQKQKGVMLPLFWLHLHVKQPMLLIRESPKGLSTYFPQGILILRHYYFELHNQLDVWIQRTIPSQPAVHARNKAMFCGSFSSYWKALPIQCKILFCEDVLNFVPKVPEKLKESERGVAESRVPDSIKKHSHSQLCFTHTQKVKTQHKRILQMLLNIKRQSIAKWLKGKRFKDQEAATVNGILQTWEESAHTMK